MTMRLLALSMLFAIAFAPAARAAPLAGRFSSPLGPIAVTEKAGEVKATILDAKNPCGMKKGAVVLTGSRLDDSLVGTLHACKLGPGDGCNGPVEGAAMLLITRNGTVLSGAVHLDAHGCKTPLGGESVVLKKSDKPAVSKAPEAPPQGPPKKGTPRERAYQLATEAFTMLQQSDGNAEGAREKFQQAIKADADYAEGYIGVGITFFARDRYDEALEWYKKALEVNPALGDAYYNIGCVYAVKGDSDQAMRYLRMAVMNGYVQLATLSEDKDLSSLNGLPAFEALKQGVTDEAPAPVPVAAPVDAGPATTNNSSSIDRPAGQ